MLRITIGLLLIVLTSSVNFAQSNSREAYIKKFKKIAIKEMDRAGIPASIKLAQGILESNAGKSTLAKKAKNHFGMKCGSQWTGRGYYLKDDDYDDKGKLTESCFRVYDNAEESYIAHSEFLRDPRKRYRYGDLFRLNPRDYKAWAHGLKASGYATSPTYAQKLISIIERYKLYQYDKKGAPKVEPPKDDRYDDPIIFEEEEVEIVDVDDSGIKVLNDVKMVLAEKDDTPLEIADRTGTNVKCLLKYNDRLSSPTQSIPTNARVYIQNKRNGYRGKQKYHQVKEGETMYYISQAYGVKLKKLRKRNRIEKGREPVVGSLIKLRGWKVSKSKAPKTVSQKDRPEKEFLEAPAIPKEDVTLPPTPSKENPVPPKEDAVKPPSTTIPTDDLDPTPDAPVDELEPEEDLSTPFDENSNQEEGIFHVVKQGDTLYRIGKTYNVPLSQIIELNKLKTNVLSLGQRLRIE